MGNLGVLGLAAIIALLSCAMGSLVLWLALHRGNRLVRVCAVAARLLLAILLPVLVLVLEYGLLWWFLARAIGSDNWGEIYDAAFVCTLAVLLLSLTLAGLLAAWAALGRGHCLVRIVVVLAGLAILLLVPAYEMLLVLLPQVLAAAPVLAVVRRFRGRAADAPFWQFSLRDMLLFMLVVAAVLGIATSVPRTFWRSWEGNAFFPGNWKQPPILPWHFYLIFGAGAGIATILAAWLALGQCRSWKRLLVLVLVFPVAWIAAICLLANDSSFVDGFAHNQAVAFMLPPSTALMAFWLAMLCQSCLKRVPAEGGETSEASSCSTWRRWTARGGMAVFSLLLFLPLGLAYWVLAGVTPIPVVVLPEPNAYVQLLDLSSELDTVTIPKDYPSRAGSQPKAKPEDYLVFVGQHAGLLAKARAALPRPSCVTFRYDLSVTDYYFDNRWSDTAFDQVAYAFIAAGHACRHQGDYEGANAWYIDAIRLGRKASEGGISCHWREGQGIERMAMKRMHSARKSMPRAGRERLAASLRKLGEEGEPFEAVYERDTIWDQHVRGWIGCFSSVLSRYLGKGWTLEFLQDWFNWTRAYRRILIIELALEDYREDHAKYPEKLDQLVPDYLDRLPVDPFSGRPLKCRRVKDGWRIYSVGFDRQDNGAPGDDELKKDEWIPDDVWFRD